uniref:HOP2 protein n=1 Tax=Otus sunia TaxID=257818 RepID=A0A8C8B485_9STRI
AYGKQKIYFADQEQLPAASDAELRGLDREIAALAAKVQAQQQSCRQMEAELKGLNSSMTSPEMAREIEELRKDCATYTEKLERIKSATNHVTPEEKEKVKSCQGLSPGQGWADCTKPPAQLPRPGMSDAGAAEAGGCAGPELLRGACARASAAGTTLGAL